MNQTALTALLGGGVSALGVWIVARLKASGKIGTSEAARLWDAQERFRADLTAQSLQLHTELATLRSEYYALRAEHATCIGRITDMQAQLVANGISAP